VRVAAHSAIARQAHSLGGIEVLWVLHWFGGGHQGLPEGLFIFLRRHHHESSGILRTSNQKRLKPMVLLEFSMTPSTQEESKSPYVARILDVIDRSGLSYQLTPMGTIIEGDWAEVMAVVTDCFKALEVDCPRISSQIKIDYRAGTHSRMKSKMAAVETILGRKLST
jgi:uncharacterized protein (TIGR00106 family)